VSFYIKRLEAYGLHSRFDIKLNFRNDINILYGRNGSGKTTILHVLANLLNGSISRFRFLNFKHIIVVTDENSTIELFRNDKANELKLMLNSKVISRIKIVEEKSHQITLFEDRESLEYEDDEKNTQKKLKVESPAYFPAFRTMIEAWASSNRDSSIAYVTVGGSPVRRPQKNSMEELSSLARAFFGQFVPLLRYRSLESIASELANQVERATFAVVKSGNDMFSEAFVEAFSAVLLKRHEDRDSVETIVGDIDELYQQIKDKDILKGASDNLSSELYAKMSQMISSARQTLPQANDEAARAVLSVYRQSLKKQIEIQTKTYAPFEKYVDSVNEFLEGKKIAILATPSSSPSNRTKLSLIFEDGKTAPLQSLSSGERQIVSMLYAASPSFTRLGSIVLIDEPEISLHIDWQRKLLNKMMQQIGNHQIIVCTHSPEIGGDYLDAFQEVQALTPSKKEPIETTANIDNQNEVDEEIFE